MFQVTVKDLDTVIEAQRGETLLEVLQREGILIDSYCGGMGSCGKCVVRITGGEVSSPTSLEEKHLGERLREGFRLACQMMVLGSLECEVRHSLSAPSVALTESREARVEELPVKRVRVTVEKPSIREVSSLQEMVEKALPVPLSWSREALVELAQAVGTEFEVELEVVTDATKILWVEPHRSSVFLGAAFDIGTTTVACELLDLDRGTSLGRAGALNRQV
ncbi:MAG: 2Fe-2S iron-sulfur cluster-binding protein, partial [Candidatus Caldatribacteriaceae bacterium]